MIVIADRKSTPIPVHMLMIRRDQGIECPKCGCRHWLTTKTKPKGAKVNRLKTCRHCGHQIRTAETFVESRETNAAQSETPPG